MPTPQLKTDSLAYSLLGAARAITQVKAGSALPQALTDIFLSLNAPEQTRGAIQDLAYRTMRKLARAEALIALLTKKTPSPALLHSLLCCALALLCDDEKDHAALPYPAFTVVNQAVDAIAAHPKVAHTKGMVNAVLRRFLRERATVLQQVLQQPAAQWNYPHWWIAAVKNAYPQQWQDILSVGNNAPPLSLRINRRTTTVKDYLQTLRDAGMEGVQIGPYAVRLARPAPVSQIPGFSSGSVSVQDAAAQLAAPLLDVQDGMRVLDACAAPGGKTGHILECADVELLALDSDPKRLRRIEENLNRLSLQATLKVGDASTTDWWNGAPFDRILADVPCTASGIVRRHPDIRWLRRENDAAQLATISAQILDNLWQMLRPNGKLLFVTCSIWPQESERQAVAFAQKHQAIRLAAPGQMFPTVDNEQDHDGLFYALFQKPMV